LRDEFTGEWSARRGSYRILYRLDDARDLITVPASTTVRTPTADDDTDGASA